MTATEKLVEDIVFKRQEPATRFTQDSPVYPDVWLEYAQHQDELETYRADLILTAHVKSSSGELFRQLITRLKQAADYKDVHQIACAGDTVVAKLTIYELLQTALPLTNWWQKYLWKNGERGPDFAWFEKLLDALFRTGADAKRTGYNLAESGITAEPLPPVLWSVSRNRPATLTIEKSVPATKADACRRVFDIDGTGITWAIVDSGIDARHPAFRKKGKTGAPEKAAMGPADDPASNHTRILATYDFTRFRDVLVEIHQTNTLKEEKNKRQLPTSDSNDQKMSDRDIETYVSEIKKSLLAGRAIDWSAVAPLLRIPHNEAEYIPPQHPHGTHVAGILGADTHDPVTGNFIGMCPGIELYDIRVMNERGVGDEFNILAALQFVRWLNGQKDSQVIHGVNISISMVHEVASYACGQTPVCDVCDRLVSAGMVVVVAAGNQGQCLYQPSAGASQPGYRTVNITDPGNADSVITVGATHRNRPHSYGVSYFSSKGPTGDGRSKPDLVAPGEKIVSTTPDDGTDRMDGTSMAAPHVSGAAALILDKHRELIGRPKKVKEILCRTATDLGREKYFQGSGMLDVLRAVQSV